MSRNEYFDDKKGPNKGLKYAVRTVLIAAGIVGALAYLESSGSPDTLSAAAKSVQHGGDPAVTGVVVTPGVSIRLTPELIPAPDGSNAEYSSANLWQKKSNMRFVSAYGIERTDSNGDIWVGMPIAAGGKLGWVDATKVHGGITADGGQLAESVPSSELSGYSLAADHNKLVVLQGGQIKGNAPIGHFEPINS